MDCVFCNIGRDQWIECTDLLFVVFDRHPVTKGHSLIIPKNHRQDYFDLTDQEHHEMKSLIHKTRSRLLADDPQISGFNIGINCGQSAGQTVFHAHTHLIPRRSEDSSAPEGGVRGVIPSMQKY